MCIRDSRNGPHHMIIRLELAEKCICRRYNNPQTLGAQSRPSVRGKLWFLQIHFCGSHISRGSLGGRGLPQPQNRALESERSGVLDFSILTCGNCIYGHFDIYMFFRNFTIWEIAPRPESHFLLLSILQAFVSPWKMHVPRILDM